MYKTTHMNQRPMHCSKPLIIQRGMLPCFTIFDNFVLGSFTSRTLIDMCLSEEAEKSESFFWANPLLPQHFISAILGF